MVLRRTKNGKHDDWTGRGKIIVLDACGTHFCILTFVSLKTFRLLLQYQCPFTLKIVSVSYIMSITHYIDGFVFVCP